jgi:S1/P1 Nuclease
MIIHYVGDIHQPLHSATGLDSYNPKGDRGGNTEYLPSICGAGNLHAVWDSEAYNYCGFPTLVSLTAKVKNLCDVTKFAHFLLHPLTLFLASL